MAKKREKLFSKIVLIVFLVLIILGFTIPGILNNPEQAAPPTAEQRLCQHDADCYLTCDQGPVAVLCSQNLCQQNSCEEYSYYSYTTTPVTFDLAVKTAGKPVPLSSRQAEQDLFVKVVDGSVQSYSPQLALAQVLEKLQMGMNENCISVDGKYFCEDGTVTINGEEHFNAYTYVPQEGDIIAITYS